MSKLVFLSGAITGLSLNEADVWRHDLKEKIEDVTEYKWTAFNPCDVELSEHCKYLYKDNLEKIAMEKDLDMLRHSRLVIADFNHPNSLGTAAELAVAYELDIPIIGVCSPENYDKVHPWWLMQSHVIVKDYEDAFLHFIDHYVNY